MATRKQRRRREKSFRHQYEFVDYDEEGNEKPVQREVRERAEKKETKPARGGPKRPAKPTRARPIREVAQPTWRRALKRGGLMGAAMFVLFVFVFKNGSEQSRLSIALVYAVLFIPMTYGADRWAYRMYQRRLGAAAADKPKR
jgi:hypothetical protein